MNVRSAPEYESFTASLAANLRATRRVDVVASGKTNKLKGKSGVLHQVDVSFIDSTAGSPMLVVVECKNLQSKAAGVPLAYVKVLKATLDDLNGHPDHPPTLKGMIISTVRLQRSAAIFAKFYGIEYQVLSAGDNWSFKYGNALQVGLALQAGAATIAGVAAVHRRQNPG